MQEGVGVRRAARGEEGPLCPLKRGVLGKEDLGSWGSLAARMLLHLRFDTRLL